MSATRTTKPRWTVMSGAALMVLLAAPPVAGAATRVTPGTAAAPKAITAPAPTTTQRQRGYRSLGIKRPPVVRGPGQPAAARIAIATPRHGAPYPHGCPSNLAAEYRNRIFNLTLSAPMEVDRWPGSDTVVVGGNGSYGGSSNIYWRPLVWWSDGYRWQGPLVGGWMKRSAQWGWDTYPVSGGESWKYFFLPRGRYLVGQQLIWQDHADISEWNYMVDCPG